MEYKYFKLDDNIKTPQYYLLSGRGNGHTFYQLMNEARNKLIVAKYEDSHFNERNYVWLIGEREQIPNICGLLFGINVVFIPGTGIRLFKEVLYG
jgi:hypothetical protein